MSRAGKLHTRWPLVLPVLVWLAGAAAQFSEPLPPEQAFPYIAVAETDAVTLSFQLPEGYYLYRHRFAFASLTPDVVFGVPKLPAGQPHVDEFFGAVEIYRGDFQIHIPYRRSDTVNDVQFQLQLQGCADIGFCYIPVTWDKRVALPGGE